MTHPDFTLTAGPVTASARTMAAMAQPILYHYDPEFHATFDRVQQKLATIFATDNDVVVMQGEAILALEGAARALVRPGMPVLNLVQGVFGKGMGYWLADFGAELHELEVPYDQAIDPAAVDELLARHPQIELLAVVASETPSGTVSDMQAIGEICARHDVLTLVDTVSGVGGMRWETDAWGLDVCIAGPQKCLGGPPGLAMVSVSDAAWAAIEANPNAPHDSYLSLLDWKRKWLGERRFPYTPSVNDVAGLESVLDQALEEGLDAMIARHEASAAVARAGVRAMGLEPWASDEIAASCVTAIRMPEGIDNERLRDLVRERYGVMLSHGQGAGNLIRLSHMGPTATGLFPVVGLSAIGRGLADLGHAVDIGAGVEAALATLSEQRSR